MLSCGLESLWDVDEAGLRRVLAALREGLSGSIFYVYCSVLRRFLRWFGRGNLAELVKVRGRGRRRIPKVLSEEDVYQLVEAAETPRDRLIILLLWETGCRPTNC